MKRYFLKLLVLAVLLGGGTITAHAQTSTYPDRPVELVVPWAAGGGTDAMARSFAEAAKKHMPQPFVVTNKPGATGAKCIAVTSTGSLASTVKLYGTSYATTNALEGLKVVEIIERIYALR